ncbi:MAG: hypothetical protein ACF8LL_07410 [Phycisphaerales bacterium]
MIMAMVAAACVCLQAEDELAPFREEAAALRETVETDAMRLFLDEVSALPEVEARTIHYRRGEDAVAYNETEFATLAEEEKEGLQSWTATTGRYYSTFYGSPLAYTRALDLVIDAGLEDFDGKRVADMGYGAITHLRLMAQCGADVTGIEVMPILRALYSQEVDQGEVTGACGRTGSVTLVHGYWPVGVGDEVGDGYDLFMSRNTLKRGYINPLFETPDFQKVQLGVSDDAFLARIHDVLNPGGFAMVYNIGGGLAGEGEDYNAPADIEDPFPREAWEKAGFEIISYSANDDEGARAVARALGWDEGERGMKLDELFGRYTIVRRAD